MTRPTTQPTLPLILLALAALIGLLAAACGGNPNQHIEADEFFRPSAPGSVQRQTAQDSTAAAQQQEQQAQQTPQAEAQENAQAAPDDAAQAAPQDPQQQSAGQDAPEEQQAAPPPRADDVLRRYLNPSYGYSLDLICPPFCDPSSNGIDRATFLADTGRALLEIRVSEIVPADQLDNFWRESLAVPEFVETPAPEQIEIVLLGVPAWRYEWEEDRRATGGFQVRWQAIYIELGGLLYLLRGGAVLEDYEDALPALTRAFDSFIAPPDAAAAPGRYTRFDFLFDYGLAYITLEYGLPTDNPATFDAGIVVLQSEQALEAVLVWETIGEAFFDADAAITGTLLEVLGVEPQSDFRDARSVDGRETRLALSQTPIGESLVEIASFAWYCTESGREFALHVLDNDDPEAAADPLLDGFRCETAGAS